MQKGDEQRRSPQAGAGAGGGGLHAAWPTQIMVASGSGFEEWPLPVPPDEASYGEQPACSDPRSVGDPRSQSPWSTYRLLKREFWDPTK